MRISDWSSDVCSSDLSLTSSLSRSRVCTERRMKAKITKTIENICSAARIEFARKGFSDARLENVARAAGVSKQLIYHYFKSKDELYGVLLEEVARDTLSYLDDSSYDGLTPAETIELFIRRTVEAFALEPFIATMTLDRSEEHTSELQS